MSAGAVRERSGWRRYWPAYVAVLVIAIVAAAITAVTVLNQPSAPAVSMFSNNNAGTPQEHDALVFAEKHKVKQLISYDLNPGNYGLIRGNLPTGPNCTVITKNANLTKVQTANVPVCTELDWAQSLGVGVMPSFTDQLAETATNDRLVTDAVRLLDSNPAVSGYFIDDEQPAQPTDPDVGKWLDALQHRCTMMRALTNKPLLGVYQWGDDRPDHNYPQYRFLEKVHAACPSMTLGVDYYPSPQTASSFARYGPISDNVAKNNGNTVFYGGIQTIGATLRAIAGDNTIFIGQSFGWGAAYPDQTDNLGFPPNAPPPDAATMSWMLKASVYGEGQGGAGSVGLYSYADAVKSGGQRQVNAMSQAIDAFRANP